MAYTELEQLSEGEFKRLCGVSRSTFAEMVGVLHPHMNRQGRRGGQACAERGRPIEEWHWNIGENIGVSFTSLVSWGLHETTVGRIVRKVEDLLVKCGKFRLPSQRQLYQHLLGVESHGGGCGRDGNRTPPKKQKRYYSGKQKCHTLKAQLLVEFETGQIICTAIDTGTTHDFKLLKRSRLPFVSSQLCLADRGYQGFTKRHVGACTPTKKPRKQPLPQEEKQHNRALARLRVRTLACDSHPQDFPHVFRTLSQS